MMKQYGIDPREYVKMIRLLYGVEELQGYTEEELAVVKKYFNPLPPVLEEFWSRAARTEAIHRVQDKWIRPEDFDRWDWLKDGDYLVILIENQGCCRAGIRRKDLTKADPPVYVAADRKDDQRWTLCAGTLSGFLRAALAYEAVFAFPFHGDELMYWLTEEELETVRTGLEKQPFGLSGWLGMDIRSLWKSWKDLEKRYKGYAAAERKGEAGDGSFACLCLRLSVALL